MSMKTADGRTLSYHKMGKGPVLVCHPGGGHMIFVEQPEAFQGEVAEFLVS